MLLSWVGLETFGLVGVGMAFLGLYVFHSIMIYGVVRSMSGFRWQPANLRLIAMGILATAVALWARLSLAEPWGDGCWTGVGNADRSVLSAGPHAHPRAGAHRPLSPPGDGLAAGCDGDVPPAREVPCRPLITGIRRVE